MSSNVLGTYYSLIRRNGIIPSHTALKRHALNERDTVSTQLAEFERLYERYSVSLDELTIDERVQFISYKQQIVDKRVSELKVKLEKTRRQAVKKPEFPTDPNRYVHNFSSVQLDKYMLEALSLGPKFCHPRNPPNQLDLEVQFESLFGQVSNLTPSSQLASEHFKSTLVNCCYRYLNYQRNPGKQLLTKNHLSALKDLRSNPNIIISRPDKGAGIVLMDKSDYVDKMHILLSDQTKFRKMETEPDRTPSIEKAISKRLRILKQNGYIDSSTFEQLRPVGTNIPRLYGLPNIHKQGVPLRPILDMSNSPYHALARWLSSLLEPVRKHICKYSQKDTFQFIDSIANLNLNNKTMFYLDVNCLFTNVPLGETIEYIAEYIANENLNIGIPIEELKQLLKLCTSNVQFTFNDEIYRQKDGVAMGSPLGPILADIFMSKLENTILEEKICQLTAYRRYVDDTFCVVDDSFRIEEFLSAFNSAHQNISFSVELETDGSLPFLDVQLSRRLDGTIKRSVHRKATWNEQYTHFASFVPLRQKRNLIRCLTNRAKRICSSDTIETELEFLKSVFKDNGYPERFVEANMQPKTEPQNQPSVEKKQLYISLPFRGDTIADITSRRLMEAVNKTFYAAKLCITYTSAPILPLRLKDKTPVNKVSHCIYSFACSCGAGYIGKTTRRLVDRVKEHYPIWLQEGRLGSVNSSVTEHLLHSGHAIDHSQAFKPIYRVPTRLPRMTRCRLLSIAEAIAIRLSQPKLCAQKQYVHTLGLPWPGLMSQIDMNITRQ